jgi:hypothetical protein
VGAAGSAELAESAWRKLSDQFPAVTKGKSLKIQPVAVRGATLYRMLVNSFASVEDAKAFCGAIPALNRSCTIRRLAAPAKGG